MHFPWCLGFELQVFCTTGRAVWGGGWNSCCRRIPQTATEWLFFFIFLFEQFLLLNLAAPYKEGPVLSHHPPLQLDLGLSGSRAQHGPTLNSPQLAHTDSMGLPLCLYSPPCNFKQPSLSGCCSSLVWQGREPLTWLSPKSPTADPAGTGMGLQDPALVPETLLS